MSGRDIIAARGATINSQESMRTSLDFGAHHSLNNSGLVHASNTRRTGPLTVRVTTSSRSDRRGSYPFRLVRSHLPDSPDCHFV